MSQVLLRLPRYYTKWLITQCLHYIHIIHIIYTVDFFLLLFFFLTASFIKHERCVCAKHFSNDWRCEPLIQAPSEKTCRWAGRRQPHRASSRRPIQDASGSIDCTLDLTVAEHSHTAPSTTCAVDECRLKDNSDTIGAGWILLVYSVGNNCVDPRENKWTRAKNSWQVRSDVTPAHVKTWEWRLLVLSRVRDAAAAAPTLRHSTHHLANFVSRKLCAGER